MSVFALLGGSLACNVAMLFLPFVVLRKGVSREPYSLFHSIEMMWDEGLYVLAVLVVGFSLLFPFAKLGVLGWVAAASPARASHIQWLAWVERLGKWSMLDVFLVSIILSLSSQQFLVGAKPQPGLGLFIIAILLSMTAGEILSHLLGPKTAASSSPATARRSIALLALSGLALCAALVFPFLRIDDWLLRNREYSILSLVPALWRQGAWLTSLLTAAFLILAPTLAWVAGLVAVVRQRKHPAGSRHEAWMRLLQRWSMLDVFGLALVVFTLESDRIMETEINWGALFLGATLALQTASNLVLSRIAEPIAELKESLTETSS